MIAHLNGTVASISPDGAVIDVGGVGLRVQCTPGTLSTLKTGEEAHVATSLLVREDSLTLFGFGGDDERNVFELLQTASGVGPRLALAMLAVHEPDALRRAVSSEDLNALTMVPGVGKKGAQRIILELKDRLGAPAGGPGTDTAKPAPKQSWHDQVASGLMNLGWSAKDAEQAVTAVAADYEASGETPEVSAALRGCLRKLSK